MKQRLLIAGALIVLVLAAHFPALHAGFVWDDTALVLRDPLIRSWRLIPEGLQHFLFTDATASNFYRPLQRLTYTMEYASFVFGPHPYHLDNILLHGAAAVAFFFFALALLELYQMDKARALALSAIAAAAWALHPLHSGVVDYVSGRADSLAALFGFSALYCSVRALGAAPNAAWKFHALTACALLASALSKESGLIFAVIYVALNFFRRKARAILLAIVAVAFVVTIYFTLRIQANGAEVPRLILPAPLLARPIIAARALAEYTGLLIAPVNLHMDRDVETHPTGLNPASLEGAALRELETVMGVALLGAFGWWLARARKRQSAAFLLLIFSLISYAPICGLFALNATVAEHWIYIPSAFLGLAIAVEICAFLRYNRARKLTIALIACWMAALGLRSFIRARDWVDERTFFENTLAAGGDSARMLINLGTLEMNAGHLDRAQALLERALTKEPEQPFALLDLAIVALKRRDFASAHTLLNKARAHPITEAQAYEAMAVLEFQETGRVNLLRLRLASRTGPSSWQITQRYIRALDQAGRVGAAAAELRGVLAGEWYRADSWRLMSYFLAKLSYGTQAAAALAEAKRLDVHLDEH